MSEPEGPGATHVGCLGISLALSWLVFLALLDLYVLAAIWPHPTPSGLPAAQVQQETAPAAGTPAPTGTVSSTGGTANAAAPTTPSPNPPASAAPPAASAPPPPAKQNVPSGGPTAMCFDCTKITNDNQKDECECWHRVEAMQGVVCKPGEAPPKLATDPACIYLWSPWSIGFGGWHIIWGETRLLFIVMLCGFLGSLIYSLRSLFWYAGNRQLVWSWIPMTTLVPIVGSMVAVVFYLVLRGGLFSPTTSISDTSPFGFAAMSALVGMFINETVLKLKSIFETIMTKKEQGANNVPTSGGGAGSATPPTPPATPPAPPATPPPPAAGGAGAGGAVAPGKPPQGG